MVKPTQAKPKTNGVESDRSAGRGRWIVSAILLLHLTVVIVPPLNMATDGSPAVSTAMRRLSPYIDVAFLNHGYAFFAPDPPAASHLVRYRVEFDDGRPPVEHVFPDLERHWPRLLYHRHFMLSEQLRMDFIPPFPPPGASPQQVWTWRELRTRYESRWNSFERHLLAKHGGDRITMVRVLHHVPPPIESGRVNLRDPESYVQLDENGEPVRPARQLPARELQP